MEEKVVRRELKLPDFEQIMYLESLEKGKKKMSKSNYYVDYVMNVCQIFFDLCQRRQSTVV